MLTLPIVSIDKSPDCETGTHILRANSNVDHIRWTSSSGWLDEWGSDQSHILAVNLNSTVTFTLTADYREPSICPNSDSVTLHPLIMPLADMKVSPDFLTNDNMTLSAISQSRNAEWLQWYIDGSDYSSDSRISYTALNDADSVTVTLIAINYPCTDTTERTIHVRRSSIFAPNAFTPDEQQNNLFFIVSDQLATAEMWIYNRQGLLVTHFDALSGSWDGTYRSIPCPQDSYTWVMKYSTTAQPRQSRSAKGSVTLIR
jgi:gliding motility-associated-like protein